MLENIAWIFLVIGIAIFIAGFLMDEPGAFGKDEEMIDHYRNRKANEDDR